MSHGVIPILVIDGKAYWTLDEVQAEVERLQRIEEAAIVLKVELQRPALQPNERLTKAMNGLVAALAVPGGDPE